MFYVILATDRPGTLEARIDTRPEHLARLEALKSEGRLLTAGPLPAVDAADPGAAGFTGSLVVAEFPSLEDARAWAEQDPYFASGVYESVTVKPFNRVLP